MGDTVQYGPYGSSQASASGVSVRLDYSSVKNIADNTVTYTFTINSTNSKSTKQIRYFWYSCFFASVDDVGSEPDYTVFDYASLKKTISASFSGALYTKTFTIPSTYITSNGEVPGAFRVGIGISTEGSSGIIPSGVNWASLQKIKIPSMDRKSYPTLSSNSGVLKDTLTVNTNRKASVFTHNIYGRITNQSSYDTLATGVGSNTQYTIPESYASYVPNQGTAKYEIECMTLDASGNTVGYASTYYNLNLLTDSLKPKITGTTLSDSAKMSDNSTSYLQKFGAIVQNKSKPTILLSTECMYSATAASYEVKIGNTKKQTNPSTFDSVISANGSQSLKAIVTDSRGSMSAEYTESLEVLDYESPKLSSTPEVFRSDSTGVKDNTNGTYIAVKTSWSKSTLERNGVVQNFVRLRIYMNDSIVHDSGSVSSDSDKNGENIIVAGAQIASTYTMQVVLTDTAETEISYKIVVGPATRVMSFKADKTGVAIGKMSDKAGFEVQWDTDINGDLNVDGDANFNGRVDGILNADTIALFRELTGITNQGGVMLDVILQTMLKNLPQVGDYWTTETTETPESHFGFGTWVKVTDRMLVGAGNLYSMGAQDGEATHKLTISEIPSHTHLISAAMHYKANSDLKPSTGGTCNWTGANMYTGGQGGNGYHNNMPPYRAVNIWRRTA